jgi:endonuclease/exonuclease/phosphatase family metal-dependent hydrolase
MLLSGAVQNQPFQLLVTHLQGDDGTGYKPSHQTTRDAQMQQISRELLQPYGRAGVPLFLCGDLSTPRVEARDHRQETRPYRQMLDTFQVHNHPDFRATLDDDIRHNDLATDDTGLVQELDYILVRPGLVRVSGVWQRHVIQAPGWDRLRRHRDLSYRYAVGAEFTIG